MFRTTLSWLSASIAIRLKQIDALLFVPRGQNFALVCRNVF